MTVRWRGLTAAYSHGEREIMAALPVKEQAFVHALKAFTDGEISQDPGTAERLVRSRGPSTEGEPAPCTGDPVGGRDTPAPRPGLDCIAVDGSIPSAGIGREPQYVDPEDIPFGKPKRTYALAWTKDKIRPFKTKAGKKKPWESAEPKLRVWKRWYERQGWTIFGSATGGWHIARSPEGELHAAIIREYDQETKKRF